MIWTPLPHHQVIVDKKDGLYDSAHVLLMISSVHNPQFFANVTQFINSVKR